MSIKPFWIHVGLDPSKAGDAIQKLRKSDAVVELTLSDGPNASAPASTNGSGQPRAAYKKHDVKNADFVLSLLLKDAMPTSVIKQHFSDVHRNPSSVASTLSDLQAAEQIKKDERRDAWILTKKTRDRLRKG